MNENHFFKTIFNEANFKPEDFDLILSQYKRLIIKRNDFMGLFGAKAGMEKMNQTGLDLLKKSIEKNTRYLILLNKPCKHNALQGFFI